MLSLLDRYIISRTLANFLILFVLVFLFAVSIDVMVALDRFVEATKRIVGADATTATGSFRTVQAIERIGSIQVMVRARFELDISRQWVLAVPGHYRVALT